MRTIPVMNSLAAEIVNFCPNALLLNYVNPMSAVCLSLANSGVIGLCGVKLPWISYHAIPEWKNQRLTIFNHMGWFIKLRATARDLYPKPGGI